MMISSGQDVPYLSLCAISCRHEIHVPRESGAIILWAARRTFTHLRSLPWHIFTTSAPKLPLVNGEGTNIFQVKS